LRLGLGEPHGWPLGPERREPYDPVRCLHSPSGSLMWCQAHTERFVLTLKRAVSALDSMKSVVVSVARDGMKNMIVSAGR
jgi:hypothetical protein